METRTRDLIFGTGRTQADLRGTFAPAGMLGEREKGAVLSTFKGFGREGVGRDAGLRLAERLGLITAEQRAAGGPVAAAADGASDAVRGLAQGGAGTAAAQAGQQYANPVYHGLFAQHLMHTQGFVPPMAPAGHGVLGLVDEVAGAAPVEQVVAGGADDAGSVIAAAADDVAHEVVSLEQQLVASFKRLAQLPDDAKVPVLARAVDATAAAGHGGDAFDVLGQALASRPLDSAAAALDESVEVALRAAPIADEVAKGAAPIADEVAKGAAPIADEVVKAAAPMLDDVATAAAPLVDDVVRAAIPKVVEAALPQVVVGASSATRSLLLGSDDALRGMMPFAAGVDDTLRLLARL